MGQPTKLVLLLLVLLPAVGALWMTDMMKSIIAFAPAAAALRSAPNDYSGAEATVQS